MIRRIFIMLLVLISGVSFALELRADYWMGNSKGNMFFEAMPFEGEHVTYCLSGKMKLLPLVSLVGEVWDGTIDTQQWVAKMGLDIPEDAFSFKQRGYWGGLEARLSPLPRVEVAASALWANYQTLSSYKDNDLAITYTGVSSGPQLLGEVAIRPLQPFKISVRAFTMPEGSGQYGTGGQQFKGTSSLMGYGLEGSWRLLKLAEIVVGYKAWEGKVILDQHDDFELTFNSNGYYLGAMLKF